MKRWEGLAQARVLGRIFKRTAIIFLCGFLLYWFPFFEYNEAHHLVLSPLSHTRILGVLQRIALAYCIASLLIYYGKPRTVIAVSIIILLLYWALLLIGGDPGNPFSMTGNLGYKIDVWLMGENHMYHGEGIAFDPEGWLSTLPAVVNVTAGWLAGRFLQEKGKTYEGLTKLLLFGFACIVTAYFWDLVFPISKKLWTSSFTIYTIGLDCVIISAIIYVVDFLGKTKWTGFFTVFGKNPLFIYLLSELGAVILYIVQPQPDTDLVSWLYDHIYRHAGLHFGSLLFAVSWMLCCWLVGLWLDRRKIYIRV
jgi:predicted acyltransferase